MKLTKLLPLLGMTSVAAIAAPLVTSCTKRGTELIWNKGNDAPLSDEDIASEQTYDSSEDATEAYFNAIADDNTLLAKDEICSLIQFVTTPKHITARVDNVDATNHKATSTTLVDGITEYNEKIHFELEGKNVQYEVRQVGTGDNKVIYFLPTLYHLVVKGYGEGEGTPADKKAAMIYAEELAKDKEWYFYAYEDYGYMTLSQKIDWTNVYDYVSTMISSGTSAYLTLEPFVLNSKYFSQISIGE